MIKEYFDIHTHILPGVDDGARNMDETIKMLSQAREQGILHIVATPHYMGREGFTDPDTLRKLVEEVRQEAKSIDAAMTIDLGQELLHGPGVIEALKHKEALTMADTRYILVEFMPSDAYETIYRAIREYIYEGYIPIIAHIERYECLEYEEDHLNELKQLGAYLQMNARSLVGNIFDRRARYHRSLVEDGWINFLGSDCHRSEGRSPIMNDAIKYLGKRMLTEDIERITNSNAKFMLQNKYL